MKTAPTASRGVVGRRVLTCVQTIDIGRLTCDPVFLVPGGFIAVTGEGPIDSNESAKTTFEAALSLVHGDPGWRQDSPQFSSYAAQLLFDPPNAPAGARVRADVGFIAAVFADASDDGSGRLVGGGDPVTVWMRLRRHDDPAFEVTVTPGVQLACGETHAERLQDAKRVWSTLRGPKWGPQRYARELFGPGVSCLSYVSTRGGRSEQRATLLGSDISQLTPEQIARQLVELAAMRHLFDNEATQRVAFFHLSRQLKTKEHAVAQAGNAAAGHADEVAAIEDRLGLLDQAAAARDRYVADTVMWPIPSCKPSATSLRSAPNATPSHSRSSKRRTPSRQSGGDWTLWTQPRSPAPWPPRPPTSTTPSARSSPPRRGPTSSGSTWQSPSAILKLPRPLPPPGRVARYGSLRLTTPGRRRRPSRPPRRHALPPTAATRQPPTSTPSNAATPGRPAAG